MKVIVTWEGGQRKIDGAKDGKHFAKAKARQHGYALVSESNYGEPGKLLLTCRLRRDSDSIVDCVRPPR